MSQVFISLDLNGISSRSSLASAERPLNAILFGSLAVFDIVCFSLSPLAPRDSLLLHSIQIFLMSSYVTMVIAATRMHRSLTDFVSGPIDVYDILNSLTFSCSLRSSQFRARGKLVQNGSPPVRGTERIAGQRRQLVPRHV